MPTRRMIMFFIAFFVFTQSAWCAEPAIEQQKPFSMGTTIALSLIPLNGPALIYVEHPVQGAVLTVTEILGLTLLGVGIANNAGALGSCSGTSDPNDCRSMSKLAGGAMIAMGAVVWFPAYLYTAIRAPMYASAHNKALETSKNRFRIQPSLAFSKDGATLGAKVRF